MIINFIFLKFVIFAVCSPTIYCSIQKIDLEYNFDLEQDSHSIQIDQNTLDNLQNAEQISLSLWFKSQIEHNINQDLVSINDIIRTEVLYIESIPQLIPISLLNERNSSLVFSSNEWQQLVLSISKDSIHILLYSEISGLIQSMEVSHEHFTFLKQQCVINIKSVKKVSYRNLRFYYNHIDNGLVFFAQYILNVNTLIENCKKIGMAYNLLKQQTQDSGCIYYQIIKNNEMKFQKILNTEENQLKSQIFVVYLNKEIFLSNEIILKVDAFTKLIFKNDQSKIIFFLIINEKEYYFLDINNLSSQIILQIEEINSVNLQYSIYLNQNLNKIIKIKKFDDKILQFSENKPSNQIDINNNNHIGNQIKIDYFILLNHKIVPSNIYNQTYNQCTLSAVSIFSQNDKSLICIFRQLSFNKINHKQIPHNNNQIIKRNLQTVQYIHGSTMRSIVRKQYKESQFKSTIAIDTDQYQNFLLIGYFKIDQTISIEKEGWGKIPIITLGIQSEYYNFLNLCIVNNNQVELRYINDEQNKMQNLTQTVSTSSIQKNWIGLGIAFSLTKKNARIIYTKTSNSQIMQSTDLSEVILPPRIKILDVCTSCGDLTSVFNEYTGNVQSVKIIYGIDFTKINNYYFFSEDKINKTKILSDTFDIISFQQNSEYNLSNGFKCNEGFVFYEGVCILKDNCQNLVIERDEHSSFETGKFYDTSSQICLNCSSNCKKCSSLSVCLQCRDGYKISSNKCIKCDESCINSCPDQKKDPMNQTCVSIFDQNIHQLSPILLSGRTFNDTNDDLQISPLLSWDKQIIHCYLDIDNNPMTFHSFIGGTYFTKQTKLSRSWTKIPKGYQKNVTFYALFYGNGAPSNLQVMINQQKATLNSDFSTLLQNKKVCSKSGSQTQSIYLVVFSLKDIQNKFDLEISSNVDKWGVRNVNIQISKCHPSCNTCYEGGSKSDCASCSSGLVENMFSCTCQPGYFVQYGNCFDIPCTTCQKCEQMVQNCVSCEDITGKCTQCFNQYLVKDGKCIRESQCANLDQKFSNFCTVKYDFQFEHFKNNKIVQYGDYWKFNLNNAEPFQCFGSYYLPLLAQNASHTINTIVANRNFHYNAMFKIDILAVDNLVSDDLVILQDRNLVVGKLKYADLKNKGKIVKNDCGNQKYTDVLYQHSDDYVKKTSILHFQFYSVIKSDQKISAFTFNSFEFYRGRCHIMCQTCNGQKQSDCVTCIENAKEDNNNNCECNTGYYFSQIRYPKSGVYPGQCLKCDSSCHSCKGPSYQDCLTCEDEYTLIDNLCLYRCMEGYYWDNTLKTCKQCHVCCRKCTSADYKCHDCRQGYQITNIVDYQCIHSILNTQCVPCAIAINSFCGGDQSTHNDCINNGWIKVDSNNCMMCGKYINGNCGGEQSQVYINQCIQGGCYNYNSSQCSSCYEVYQNNCGRNEIQEICRKNNWTKYDKNSCMNCSPTSQTLRDCKCDITCETCGDKFFNSKECQSCSQPLSLFQKECLPICPNGYTSQKQICVKCSDEQIFQCYNCYQTCFLCDPLEISQNPKTCKSCTNLTRELVNGECICKDYNDDNIDQDEKDKRLITFECSYQNVAVIEPILSNSKAILSINFQKKLIIPSGFQNDIELCQIIFESDTIKLFGTIYHCKIEKALVYVEIDKIDASLIEGDLIKFKKNVLKFTSTFTIFIDQFYNNVVSQEKLVGQSQVIYQSATELNSCNDIQINLDQLINTGERGFHKVSWSISIFQPLMLLEYTRLSQFLQKQTNQQTDFVIQRGIIKPDVLVSIQLNYILKVNVSGKIEIPISVKIVKKINLQIKPLVVFPLYKFQKALIIIYTSVIQCDTEGIKIIEAPINFNINSSEFPKINYQNTNYNKLEHQIEILPYTLPNKLKIDASAQLVSDTFLEASESYILNVTPSQIIIKIIGGNGYLSYQSDVELIGQIRDPDLLTEDEPQGIDFYWICEEPGKKEIKDPCKDKHDRVVNMPGPQEKLIVFQNNTFSPYTVIQLTLKGLKSNQSKRNNSDTINVLFSELDLPRLNVKVGESLLQETTINMNEEIYVQLNYNSSVNVDILSFSGTIVYKEDVVGVIIFDYFILKFQIWNYFSGFKRGNNEFLVRFNVFNPKYYMPSIILMTFKINFPPKNCRFTVIQPPDQGYSLETKYLLQMEDCEDDNVPIKYQFYFYLNKDDFDYEKRYPKQVKRRQLTDQQTDNNIVTSLPYGKLLLMAQAIDQKQAIYNDTLSIDVKLKDYNENDYIKIIQQKLDSVKKQSTERSISDLSILSDDILLRNQFMNSPLINQKKIEVYNKLSDLIKNLSNISTFMTLADKAKASLVESGIIFNQQQSVELITDLINELDESINFQQFSMDISKEKLKQKLYDNFKVLDSLSKSEKQAVSQQKLIELQNNIGRILFKNVLPNENPILFKGQSAKIISSQVTQKHVCSYFICEYDDGINFNQIDPEAKTNIYDIKILSQNENLYSSDESFQNYTSQLLQAVPTIQLSKFPIITPSINDEKHEVIPSFKNKVALKFPSNNENVSDKKMACLSRINERWTNSGCQNYYNKDSKSYTCICQQLSPTTIIEDLDDLLYKNNLSTSFSEEGLQNIAHFKEFYKYVVFYILISSTILFFILYKKGKAIDLLFQQRVAIQPIEKCEQIPKKQVYTKGATYGSAQQVIPEVLSNIDIDTENQNNVLINSNKNKERKSKGRASKTYVENVKEIQKPKRHSVDRNGFSKVQAIMKLQSPSIGVIALNNSSNDIFSKKNYNQNSNQDVITVEYLNENEKSQLKTPSKESVETQNVHLYTELSLVQIQEDQSVTTDQDYDNFQQLSVFRSIFIFHNFVGIFFIYNPNLPRSLRFLVFYVRLIHSLAITTIFDQDYSIVQKIGVGIINAISLLVIVFVLEKMFVLKISFLRIASRVFSLLLLAMYYYIILSIVSGQSPSQSNKAKVTFLIFSIIDILIVSSISAVCQKYLTLHILKDKSVKGCMRLIYKSIELQIILQSLR